MAVHRVNLNANFLKTPKLRESILARLDMVGSHFKYIEMFRKLRSVIEKDLQQKRLLELHTYHMMHTADQHMLDLDYIEDA